MSAKHLDCSSPASWDLVGMWIAHIAHSPYAANLSLLQPQPRDRVRSNYNRETVCCSNYNRQIMCYLRLNNRVSSALVDSETVKASILYFTWRLTLFTLATT
jgi:hypothetical protein